jgi:hypothetical protein
MSLNNEKKVWKHVYLHPPSAVERYLRNIEMSFAQKSFLDDAKRGQTLHIREYRGRPLIQDESADYPVEEEANILQKLEDASFKGKMHGVILIHQPMATIKSHCVLEILGPVQQLEQLVKTRTDLLDEIHKLSGMYLRPFMNVYPSQQIVDFLFSVPRPVHSRISLGRRLVIPRKTHELAKGLQSYDPREPDGFRTRVSSVCPVLEWHFSCWACLCMRVT